jgi:hypothetical protein
MIKKILNLEEKLNIKFTNDENICINDFYKSDHKDPNIEIIKKYPQIEEEIHQLVMWPKNDTDKRQLIFYPSGGYDTYY